MNVVKKIIQENLRLSVGMSSILGTRQYQQDYVYYYSEADHMLGIICDGMGGLEGGERASKTAAEILAKNFEVRDKEISIPAFLREQAEVMNKKVADLKGMGGKPLRSGTTVVAVVAEEERLFWLSVGDSRIYIIRNEEMSQVNREHNYRLTLKQSRKDGTITEKQYQEQEKSGRAEALISYLGISRLSLLDINTTPFELMDGDIVLLCSDGLYKSLNDSQIKALIRDNDIDMSIASERLCSMALRCAVGGQDNTSVLAIQFNQV